MTLNKELKVSEVNTKKPIGVLDIVLTMDGDTTTPPESDYTISLFNLKINNNTGLTVSPFNIVDNGTRYGIEMWKVNGDSVIQDKNVYIAGTLAVGGTFTVGGGYGSSGVTISSAGAISADGVTTIGNQLIVHPLYDTSYSTGTPIAKFHRGSGADNYLAIFGDASAQTIAAMDDAGNQKALHLRTTGNNGNIVLYPHGTGKVYITTNDFIVDTDTLYVDATNDRVGIGESSPDEDLHITNGTEDPAIKLEKITTNTGSGTIVYNSSSASIDFRIA
jgi:hypothetical protein